MEMPNILLEDKPMDQKRLLELAGIIQLDEAILPKEEPKEIDFDSVKAWLKKKYGSDKDVDGMSKMELTKAAVGMKEGMEYNEDAVPTIKDVVQYVKKAKEKMAKEDWLAVVNHVSTM